MKSISAFKVALEFCQHWVFSYGAPVSLLSDNGGQFVSKFFQAVCKALNIHNAFTTAYHPQTNGQVERFNRTLKSARRRYVAEDQKSWDVYTDALTYGSNTKPTQALVIHHSTWCYLGPRLPSQWRHRLRWTPRLRAK